MVRVTGKTGCAIDRQVANEVDPVAGADSRQSVGASGLAALEEIQ